MTAGQDGRLPYERGDGVVRLRLRATPKASRDKVGGLVRDAQGRAALAVRVTAAPADGKANEAVIEALARALGLAKSRLSIRAGAAARDKLVAIAGDPAAIAAALDVIMSDHER